MNKDTMDLFALCFMLLRDKKFEDIVISGATCFSSIKNFNNTNEVYDYIQNRYATELLFRKNGRDKFTERVYLHQIVGFKLNEKSVTFKLKNENYNIRF